MTNKVLFLALVLNAASSRLAFSGEPYIALFCDGQVDAAIKERVEQGVEANLLTMTEMVGSKSKPLSSFDKAIAWGKGLIGTNIMAVLILSEKIGDKEGRHIQARDGVVVVDVDALRPEKTDSTEGRESWLRRVEKECVGGLAFVLGLQICNHPTCALGSTPLVDETLDAKGRGLCPPCMGKWDAKKETLGK